jgi:2-polyprenyl-3-methyl-5-hydroxy-6-metoxy-1,4-benzoquinol methylase/glycosyltransferase involved in cell wall biosynthesis
MQMNGETISSGQSLGGSETCAINLTETLAKLGQHVVLFCNTEQPHEKNGVFYQPMGWINHAQGSFPKGFIDYARSTPTDVAVIQRIPGFLSFPLETKVNLLWQHDLATRMGPSNFHGQLWNIDKVMVLSEFMKKQYQLVHSGPDHLYELTRNGIDLDLIDSVPAQERDRFKLVYTARPERGLDILLERVFPLILKLEPRAKLYLSRYSDPNVVPMYQQLDQVIQSYGDKVVFLGNLGKQELYKHYKQARLYIYSSAFEETSCITSQEVGACGTPFLGPWRGALPETCAGASYLIRDDGSPGRAEDDLEPGFQGVSEAFCKAMAEKAVELMHDDNQWESWSKKARKRAESWTWGPVAEQWVELAHELIAKRSDEPVRMTKHFLVHSDVVAAKKYTESIGDTSLQLNVQRYIDHYVPFMNESDLEKRRLAIRDFYESRSGGDYANYQTGFYAEGELRLHALIRYLEGHPEVKTLLDFGCAHGGYARVLSNRFPYLKIVGVDTSPSLVRCGEELRDSKLPDGSPACLYPQNITFQVADEDTDLRQTFDAVVCMEVLEHIPHAEDFAQKLERFCKPGGHMIFTVPNGRRERDELVTKGIPPVHVRSFDLHDLRDLFGKRKDYSVASFSDNQEIAWDKSFAGWFMVSYTRDDGKIGEIDWERKFFLQGPRETLSVCMITNNCDETLRRCLKSVEHVADQLIVIDNGPSTDRTVETAMEFGAEIRAGTSPFYCYAHMQIHRRDMIQPGVCDMAGFETPRNESTEGAWADHIMWIDADEKFTDTSNVYKYLRPNIYYGYAVRQHHLGVDVKGHLMTIDLPVRIYRNKMGIKFYGIVHEHAELGPDRGMGKYCSVMEDLNISHDGYINEEVRRGRFHRNYQLLQCDRLKHPTRKLGMFLYEVRDNLHMARYTLERNQGQVTAEVRAYCENVVKAYRENFMCQTELAALAHSGLNYYSEALGILGLGFEVLHSISVSRSGPQPAAHERFRAMDKAEAAKLLAFHLDQVAGPIEGPYIA